MVSPPMHHAQLPGTSCSAEKTWHWTLAGLYDRVEWRYNIDPKEGIEKRRKSNIYFAICTTVY